MTVSPRSGGALRNNDTRTVLHEIQPRVEHQSRRELSQVSDGHLHTLKRQRSGHKDF
jgi:hypothetical protein